MAAVSIANQQNAVYLTTNELGQQKTLRDLKRTASQGNTLCGVSGFFVLNLASLERAGAPITHLALFDLSDRVEAFWQQMAPMIQDSPNPPLFLESLEKHLDESWQEYFLEKGEAARYMSTVQNEIKQGVSWLSNPNRFKKIQEIFRNNHFSFTRLDLTDSQSFRAYLENLAQQGSVLDTIYISNINCCLEKAQFHPYHDALKQIPAKVNIIDAAVQKKEDKVSVQRLFDHPPGIREAIPLLYRLLHSTNIGDIESGLDDGLDPDERDTYGYTPLMTAAEKNHEAAIDLLLKAGADVHANIKTRTALHVASGAAAVRALLQAGANIDAQDDQGLTPLHLAAAAGRSEAIDELLAQKADLNLRDAYGFTPLELGLSVLAKSSKEHHKIGVLSILAASKTPLRKVLKAAQKIHSVEQYSSIAAGAKLLKTLR